MTSEIRSEILDSGDPKVKLARIEINAPASTIFHILSQPNRHPEFDGSRTVKGQFTGDQHLFLGAKFGMKMKLGIRYRIINTVVEFKENEVIAWRHLGRWVWRYELKELSPNKTLVTETFDGRPSPFQWWLKARKAYPFTQIAVAKTLVRLKKLAELQ
jgi:hypothetical protein